MANRLKYNLKKALTEPAPWEVDIEAWLRSRRPSAEAARRHFAAAWKRIHARRAAERKAALEARAEGRRAAWRGTPSAKLARGRAVGAAPRGPQLWPGQNCASVLEAMAGGGWHGLPDLARSTGLARNTLRPILYQRLRRWGLAEKGRNAAWRPAGLNGDNPRYLWRLTETGQLAAQLAGMMR